MRLQRQQQLLYRPNTAAASRLVACGRRPVIQVAKAPPVRAALHTGHSVAHLADQRAGGHDGAGCVGEAGVRAHVG